ncbi:hypothetical protein QBC47DRAFT_416452 [Echria macrotheca]|uniref:Uncharacterized protein n=1 Tax=Echria macrotheca TaxID=438768 RepID=A0AAJ0B5L1_9PEZI|nr:hypothetical protein QBC47DRAFT_416452 [Echria macrotheca]
MAAGNNNNNRSNLQFIHINSPNVRGHLSGHRSSIHAHAARVTRARRRQRQTRSAQHESEESAVKPDENAETALTTTTPISLTVTVYVPGTDLPMDRAGPMTTTERFLLNHYITIVIPDIAAHCTKLRCRGQEYIDMLDREWITFALRDPGFRNSAMLRSCRHLASVVTTGDDAHRDRRREFDALASRFKLACIQALQGAIAASDRSGRFSDSIVAQTLELAHDEIKLGERARSRDHIRGAYRMVEMNGGSHTLGLNGFLETVLFKSMSEVGLLTYPSDMSHANVLTSAL